MLSRVRLSSLGAAAALLVLALWGCDAGLFVEPAPAPTTVALQLTISGAGLPNGGVGASGIGAAQGVEGAFDAVDRARVQLQLDGSEGLDEVVDAGREGGDLRLIVEVELDDPESSGSLEIELRTGSSALFRGATQVTLERGTTNPVELSVDPVPADLALPPSPAPFEAIGDSVPLGGAVRFATGDTIPDVEPDWSSLHPGIVAVDGDFAVATGEGTATLRAQYGALSSDWTVRVEPIVVEISVSPESLELAPESEAVVSADLRDRRGNPIQSVPVEWSSEDPSVATVDDQGTVRAIAPGSTRIFARAGGLEAWSEVEVTVLPPGVETLAPSAVGEEVATFEARIDPRGSTTQVVFEYGTDPGLAGAATTGPVSVAGSAGSTVVTRPTEGLEPGTRYHVRARGTNEAGTSVGEIVAFDTDEPAVATVTVIPGELQIGPGFTSQLEVELRDARGELLSDRPVDWRSENPEIATVDGSGVVEGIASGTTDVVATVEGVEGSAAVEVILLPPLAVTMEPSQVFERQARLDASVTPRTATTSVRFRWSASPTLQNASLTSPITLEPSSEAQLVRQTLFSLNDNTTYYYRVEATNDAGTVQGEILSFRTLWDLPAPTDLSVGPDGWLYVNWSYPQELVSEVVFELERAVVGSSYPPTSWSLRATVEGTFFEDRDIESETTYAYRVRACDGVASCSDYSNVDSASTGSFIGLGEQARSEASAPTRPPPLPSLRDPVPLATASNIPLSMREPIRPDLACRPESRDLSCTLLGPLSPN